MVGLATSQAEGQPLSRLLIGQNRVRLQKLKTWHGGRPARVELCCAWDTHSRSLEKGETREPEAVSVPPASGTSPNRWGGTGPLPWPL